MDEKKIKYPFNDWSKSPEGLDEWREEMRDQIKRKFGIDADGDCPVNLLVIDRTKYQPLHYQLVPYEHEAKTPAQRDKIEQVLLTNLTTALNAYSHFLMLKREIHSRKED
jgi:hypothetical protein